MFSVPGWSLSAPLKTQKESSNLPPPPTENGNTTAPPSSKKRKRNHNKSKAPAVTAENVAELWETHIEGKKPAKIVQEKSQLEKREKKRKHGEVDRPKERETSKLELSNGKNPKSSINGVATESSLGTEVHAQGKNKKDKKSKKQKKEGEHSIDKELSLDKAIDTPKPKAIKPPKSQEGSNHAAPITKQQENKNPPPPPQPNTKLTPLQASMRAKLASARFRHLNQTLYTSPSTDALKLFTKNPEMYSEYHAGFRQQVEVWPENPVDGYISLIQLRGKAKLNKKGEVKGHKPTEDVTDGEIRLLPRTQGACTIADLGCGDARLSQSLQPALKKMNMKILSFDLHSDSPLVKKADISALPLADGSVNVAIFCLALMGTNWTDFIDEAWRILHWKGELWVAEIKSRFARGSGKKGNVVDHSVGKKKKKPSQMSEAQRKKAELEQRETEDTLAVEVDGVENAKGETDVSPFLQVLRGRGFVLDGTVEEAVDLGNRMFVRMRFVKAVAPTKGKNVEASSAMLGSKPGMQSKTNFRGKYVRSDPEAGGEDVDENAVLKPCVYKLR
jgi:ribosomal RNA-processing protein 8